MDTHFPSPEVSQGLLGAASSPILGKQMYGDDESIKTWISHTNTSVLGLNDSDDTNVFEFVTYPFRTCHLHSPSSDKFESEGLSSVSFDSSDWDPKFFASTYHDDSDESRSESSLSDGAQYVTIPFDSPWYRRPSPSPGPVTAYELSTAAYTSSCSSDVRQAIAQQQVLLAIFYEELRRAVPRDDHLGYDPDWLGEVDVDLVLAPLETYADICWESTISDRSVTSQLGRPVPDVPIGFDDIHGLY